MNLESIGGVILGASKWHPKVQNSERSITLRKLPSYVAKYGPEVGPKLYHVL